MTIDLDLPLPVVVNVLLKKAKSLSPSEEKIKIVQPVPKTDLTIAANFYPQKDVFWLNFLLEDKKIMDASKTTLFRFPMGTMTPREVAVKLDAFVKGTKCCLDGDEIENAFNDFLFQTCLVEKPRIIEPSKDLLTVGRERMPGETEWFKIQAFKETAADNGKAVVWGKPFLTMRDLSEEVRNVIFQPEIQSTEQFGEKPQFVFLLGDGSGLMRHFEVSYCQSLMRQEMAYRFELAFGKSPQSLSKNSSDRSGSSALYILDMIYHVETVLGKLPAKGLSLVANAYVNANYPQVHFGVLQGRKTVYSKSSDLTPPTVVVQSPLPGQEKEAMDVFLGRLVASGRWPEQPLDEFSKKNNKNRDPER